jgi:transcriptional regulator of met regulon
MEEQVLDNINRKIPLNILLMDSQSKQLEHYANLYHITKTQIISEALQYWFAAQRRGEKDGVV